MSSNLAVKQMADKKGASIVWNYDTWKKTHHHCFYPSNKYTGYDSISPPPHVSILHGHRREKMWFHQPQWLWYDACPLAWGAWFSFWKGCVWSGSVPVSYSWDCPPTDLPFCIILAFLLMRSMAWAIEAVWLWLVRWRSVIWYDMWKSKTNQIYQHHICTVLYQ